MSAAPGRIARWLATGAGIAAGAYATHAAVAWLRYGRPRQAMTAAEQDPLLDRYMPEFEVVERHHVRVEAPAALTLRVAGEMDMQGTAVVRAIIRSREWLLGADKAPRAGTRLMDELRALGWGVLAERPDRETVLGAVTQPWEPNVVFRAVPPDDFAAFDAPGFAKIVVSLRADPVDDRTSIFRTETRVATTDPAARARFRRYWALLSPGIILIRWAVLWPLKREAERRWRSSTIHK